MSDLPAWLPPALTYIEAWLEHQMRVTEQPGCAAAITFRGDIVFDLALGAADLASGEALTNRHRFRVASHSKTFTAAAILKLRERERIGLDDRIGKFVTGLHEDVAAGTIGQLLSHSAGLTRDGVASEYWCGREPFPVADRLRADLTVSPTIPAATRFKYSNHGYALAGLIIEAVVGESYGTWMEREIVNVVGLESTTPDIDAASAALLASGHSDKSFLGRRQSFRGDQSTCALAPAAGFVSTAADLCRFFAQLSPGAESPLLSVASRREMTRRQWRDPYRVDQQFYGLGTMLGTLGDWEWFGHGGGFQGYITKTAVVPDQDLAVSILTNARDGKAHEWVDGALGILQRFRKSPAGSHLARDWSGRWWNVWGPIDLVAIGERVLLATPEANNPLAYAPEITVEGPDVARITEAGAFHHFGEQVQLLRDAMGTLSAVRIGGTTWVKEEALRNELSGMKR